MKIDSGQMIANASDAEKFLKHLANKHRLMILCMLLDREMSVGELNERVQLSQSALSQHLQVLRDADLVATRRESQTIYYSIRDQRIGQVIKTLYDVFCVS